MALSDPPYVVLFGAYDDTDLQHLAACLVERGVQAEWFQLGRAAEEYGVSWTLTGLPDLRWRGVAVDISRLDSAIGVVFKLARVHERDLATVRLGSGADDAFGAREWNTTFLNAIQILIDT